MSAIKIAVLQAKTSKATDLLVKELPATSLEGASASAPVGLIADTASATKALEHVVAKPETVSALALIAPGAIDKALADKLSVVTIPVLALFGTRDSNAQASGTAYRKALPTCNVTFVYDTTGDMANERPEAVAAALREFVRQREKYVVTDKSAKLYP